MAGEANGGRHSVALTEQSGHLTWYALVVLALTRQDGSVLSPAQENRFLTR